MSTKRKLPAKLGQPLVKQSAKPVANGALNDSKAVVSSGGYAAKPTLNGVRDVVNISSDESGAEDEMEDASDAESDAAEEQEAQSADGKPDVPMEDASPIPEDGDEAEAGEPSFGDMVRANVSEPIDVAGAFDDSASRAALAFPPDAQIQAPSGASLGTVLSQALRTNDVALLESCLHTTDINTIRATIQRLDSPLAGTLLQKLAERLHRRPGRAGSLMVWVQWTLVTHGGYLATQRNLVKKLAELSRVIDDRAKGLQSLLSLKGKLDMLEAQIELRRSMQGQRRQSDEEDDDEGVIYVEGQESDEEAAAKPKRLTQNGDLEDISDGESDISEDMPMRNGMVAESEDEEGESSDEGDLIDDEAEETDDDDADENEVDHDDLDSQGEDEESDDGAQGAPPSKLPRTGGLSSRKR
jgi:U3 small nucleolar RNA-associated protein 5